MASAIAAVFSDDFETGDKSATAGGFVWGAGGATVETDEPREGTYSLRFRYAALPDGDDEDVPNHFTFDAIQRMCSIEYYWHIPSNYLHRSQAGQADETEQHKLYALHSGEYGGTGRPKVVLELWRLGDFESELRIVQNFAGGASSLEPPGGRQPGISPTGPLLIGQWNRMRIFQDTGTEGNDDARFRLIVNDTTVFDYGVGELPNTNNTLFFWDTGYLMGATNAGYDVQTDFHIDDFRLDDTDPGWWP